MAHSLSGLGGMVIAWLALAAIVLAEVITSSVNPNLGLGMHAATLLGLAPLAARISATVSYDADAVGQPPALHLQNLLRVLTLIPLIRLISLAFPLRLFPPLLWYPITAVPLFAASWSALRVLKLPPRAIGLGKHNTALQLIIGFSGLWVGFAAYWVLKPGLLLEDASIGEYLIGALCLVLFSGFLDELIFRGLLLNTAWQSMGWAAVIYVSAISAAMSLGKLSAAHVATAFAVSLLWSVLARRSGSIIGVALAHGAANVVLYVIMPAVGAQAFARMMASHGTIAVTAAATVVLFGGIFGLVTNTGLKRKSKGIERSSG